jgi:hypothetical protein
MALKHQRVKIRYNLVTTLDRVSNERSNLWIHPWLDDAADSVVVCICLETVDSKSWRINTELYPTEEKFGAWLWAFKTTNVVAITLVG